MVRRLFPDEIGFWMKENQDRLGIHLLRFIFALLWISQGLSKVFLRDDNKYDDNNKFLGDINWMKETHPNSFVVSILNDIVIPNIDLFLIMVIFTELFIGLSLGLGLFSRLGAIIGGIMTLVLWILTIGWDEWLWTFPLIFFPHVLFFLSQVGKEIGIDRILSENEDLKNSKILNFLM